MNLQKVIDSNKLYDLYNQIFDYFSLTIYDLESKIRYKFKYLKILKINLKLFLIIILKMHLNEFNEEIKKLKDQIPEDFLKIENLLKILNIVLITF